MGKIRAAIIALGLSLGSFLSAAEEPAGADLQFVSEVTAIQPGVPFTLALHIHHHEGFHTYWKAPGIVGLPTSLEWSLPKGFAAGPIQWPAPELVDMAGHPAHGYHRDVLLLVEITPPKSLTATKVTLAAEAAWMACAKTCHPGFRTISLDLPVTAAEKPQLDPKWQPQIVRERAALPTACPDWTATIESRAGESPILLRLTPKPGSTAKPGVVYFFSGDGQVSSEPLVKTKAGKDGAYLLTLPRCEFDSGTHQSLPGILSATGSWTANQPLQQIRIDPRYPTDVNAKTR